MKNIYFKLFDKPIPPIHHFKEITAMTGGGALAFSLPVSGGRSGETA
jgi:hypothetical protein